MGEHTKNILHAGYIIRTQLPSDPSGGLFLFVSNNLPRSKLDEVRGRMQVSRTVNKKEKKVNRDSGSDRKALLDSQTSATKPRDDVPVQSRSSYPSRPAASFQSTQLRLAASGRCNQYGLYRDLHYQRPVSTL